LFFIFGKRYGNELSSACENNEKMDNNNNENREKIIGLYIDIGV
jgi:hypothetical protein